MILRSIAEIQACSWEGFLSWCRLVHSSDIRWGAQSVDFGLSEAAASLEFEFVVFPNGGNRPLPGRPKSGVLGGWRMSLNLMPPGDETNITVLEIEPPENMKLAYEDD
ncbi:hypothetical protein V6N12_072241 [Hibiscus sabdariffa]|uniref:Uncharacterized protein n=1 Tax=Hibiscus sabdariffa TaxID=183260 RepID=A0ABR2FM50_9ROSI